MGPVSRFDLRSLPGPRRLSSSSLRGEGVFAAALLVSSAGLLSLVASGHATVYLARIAWTPLIVAAALLGSLDAHRIRRVLPWVIAAALLATALDTAIQWCTGMDLLGFKPYGRRLTGPLPHPNDTALWACLLPWTPLVLWPVSFALIVLSSSRMALAGALVVAVWLAPRAWRWRLIVYGAIAFGFYLFFSVIFGHVGQTNGLARLGMWAVGWEMWKAAPLVGQGPSSFVDAYLPTLQVLGPKPFGVNAEWAFVPWAHNLIVEALAELGLFGFLALALPLVWACRQGSRRVRIGVAALLIMGLVDLTFLKPWVVGVYWGLLTLASAPESVRG